VYRNPVISPDTKWPLTPSREYVNLALVESGNCRDEYIGHALQGNIEQILNNRVQISVEQILKPEGDGCGAALKLVLIEGAPGIGKTSLAWELCRKWEEFPCMKQYGLVILLRLRESEVQEIDSVRQLFCSYESEDKEHLVQEVLRSQGRDILFILDGFDELPRTLQRSGFLLNLIKGQVLSACTVLVTTRPSATAQLLMHCHPQRRVEILGFTQESIRAYASNVFPTKSESFLSYISASSNPAINSLMYIPLNAAIVVQIYQDHEIGDASIFPHTLTELYKLLCLTLLNRYLEEEGLRVDTFENLPDPLYQQFLRLSELAFEGMKNKAVIFHTAPADLVHFGFLNAVTALYGGGRVSYNFLHLTIQEFLAAYFISQLGSNGLPVFRQYGGNPDWKVVWRFVAGLTKFEHFRGQVLNQGLFVGKYKDDEVIVLPLLILCLFEAQSFENFHSHQLAPSVYTIKPDLLTCTALDLHALGYCLSNIPTSVAWDLYFYGFAPPSSSSECFTKPFMQNVNSANVIRKLKFVCCRVELLEFVYLPLHEITVLQLSLCELTNTDLVNLSEFIPCMPSLKELDLSGNQFTYQDGFLMVLQQLSHSSVTKLDLERTGFWRLLQSCSPYDYISAMEMLIHPLSGKLRTLRLGGEYDDGGLIQPLSGNLRTLRVGGECDDGRLANLIAAPSSLQTLHLTFLNMSSACFERNSCVTKLCVRYGNWSTFELSPLLNILRYNKTVQNLELAHFYLHDDGHLTALKAIVSTLRQNTTLQRVKVNCIGTVAPELTLDPRLTWKQSGLQF
jgi:hypothetical protein